MHRSVVLLRKNQIFVCGMVAREYRCRARETACPAELDERRMSDLFHDDQAVWSIQGQKLCGPSSRSAAWTLTLAANHEG